LKLTASSSLIGYSSTTSSAQSGWTGTSFQNRSYWDIIVLFWDTRNHRVFGGANWYCVNWLDEEGISAIVHDDNLTIAGRIQMNCHHPLLLSLSCNAAALIKSKTTEAQRTWHTKRELQIALLQSLASRTVCNFSENCHKSYKAVTRVSTSHKSHKDVTYLLTKRGKWHTVHP
jgi:hypothetical protein